ncbi:MAG: M18 family aminopeptidase [Cellvibrionaceae bacterium]|nr:M18 family aminopeptidase [Cellvibrionaceae bacterium]
MSSPICNKIMAWIDASPTPYHAVETVRRELTAVGYSELKEGEKWSLAAGGRYFITRRDASILAFRHGTADLIESGLRIAGAHTDSPALKVKPKPEKISQGYFQLGIEVYGGVLLAPWFDRDLSLAGRVTLKGEAGLRHQLVNFERPVATIPSLAIHLDRTANEGRALNAQEQMRPVLLQNPEPGLTFKALLARELMKNDGGVTEDDILDFDLSFYDTQKAAVVGLGGEFLASARLDNLLSCFVGLNAFLSSAGDQSAVLALFDHEEVGSQSHVGAQGNLLTAFIERLVPEPEARFRMLHNSLMLSVDNAHGIHPNFPHKHDEGHGPRLNAGPVIKYDANQGYATSTETAALVKLLAQQCSAPYQAYVTRADLRCGSTIGPMTSAKAGIRTVDIGLPTFAMHSIRELAGVQDLDYLDDIIERYFELRDFSS